MQIIGLREIAAVVVLLSACNFIETVDNPNFCTNRGGDSFCQSRSHGLDFCSLGKDDCPGLSSYNQDGCVEERPTDDCYSPCGEHSILAEAGCLELTTSTSNDMFDETSSSSWETTSGNPVGESQDGTSTIASTGVEEDTTLGASSTSMGDDPSQQPYGPCWVDSSLSCTEPDPKCKVLLSGHNFCTRPCGDDGDCPPPGDGMTMAVCVDFFSGDRCALDCSNADCPEGMSCEMQLGVDFPLCGWPVL